jgi:hypothetical protein
MDVATAQSRLAQAKANAAKCAPIMADKQKADLVKQVDALLKDLKPVLEKRKKLEDAIAAIAALKGDVAAFNTTLAKVTENARTLAKATGEAARKADTSKRDFFMMANFLGVVGQQTSMDPPPC